MSKKLYISGTAREKQNNRPLSRSPTPSLFQFLSFPRYKDSKLGHTSGTIQSLRKQIKFIAPRSLLQTHYLFLSPSKWDQSSNCLILKLAPRFAWCFTPSDLNPPSLPSSIYRPSQKIKIMFHVCTSHLASLGVSPAACV